MREPTIQADQSLLLNGNFSESLSHWKKGSVNPGWTAVMTDTHEGLPIAYLRTGNRSSAYQTLKVPKAVAANVRYVLSFLYETNHSLAGKVIVSVEGTEHRQEIELPRKVASVTDERRGLYAAGQPLALDLSPLQAELQLELTAGQTLRVEVSSPPNDDGDGASDIRVTHMELLLHLDLPLQLQDLRLDEESLPPEGPLYVCLGADFGSFRDGHRLRFSPRDDSDWLGTNAALTIQNNPQGAILARPDWATDQPLTSEWQLSCPLIGDDEPYRFTLHLVNQYTAAPYPLEVSLGHHRVAIREVLEAAYYPVLEYEQTVRLGVQVISWYTSQALDGRTVNWTVEGLGFKAAGVTDDNGWAYFEYSPTVDGDITIIASVDSPYYQTGTVSESFAVKVLAADPWKDVLAVTEAGEAPWQDKTGYPNRGSSYPVQIKLPDTLNDTSVSLTWSGAPHDQLGVTVDPPLDAAFPVSGGSLLWTLTSEDQYDGQFRLQLVCSKLKLPSAHKAMSLARNVVKIGEVREANKSPVVDEQESVLLRVQVLHDVASGGGEPVVGALVEWTSPDSEAQHGTTGSGGWASTLYTPTSAGEKNITASIRAHAEVVPVQRDFKVKALDTSPWKNQVRILLDEKEVDLKTMGLLCWRGGQHTLQVEALPGSDMLGQGIALSWREADPGVGLQVSNLGESRPLVEGEALTWQLGSAVNTSLSRLFEMKLSSDDFGDRELFGRLISPDLKQEVILVVDQMAFEYRQTIYFCQGVRHRYHLRTHALSPLVGLAIQLGWGGPRPGELGGTSTPEVHITQLITDSGATWVFDFSNSPNSAEFYAIFGLPDFGSAGIIGNNAMKLGHYKLKIESSRELPVDPVVSQAPAWLWARVVSRFTGVAVNDAPVQWSAGEGSRTDGDGWSGCAFAPQTAGAHDVSATVVSLYDGYEDHRSFRVTALDNDPWKDLSVRFDAGEFHAWGEKTAFPRRKGRHHLELSAPDGSPLVGRQLTLGMTGTGPAELDIRFETGKGLGTPVLFQGGELAYSFDVGDIKDGSFNLRLAAERLAGLSPANAMSVGSGTQVLKFAERTRSRQVLDWNQELVEQVRVMSSVSGKPMVGIEVTWANADLGTETSVTDFYGLARVRFTPRTPGVAVLTARVGDEQYWASLELPFVLNEPRHIQELRGAEPIGFPGQEFFAFAVVASAKTAKPLPDVWVRWHFNGVSLAPSKTDIDGRAIALFELPYIKEGLLEANVEGGLAGWDGKSLAVTIEIPELLPLNVPGAEIIEVGELTLVYAKVVSSTSREPIKGAQVFWVRDGIEQGDATQTDERGETHKNFTAKTVGHMRIEAQLRDRDGVPFDSKTFVFTVIARPEA